MESPTAPTASNSISEWPSLLGLALVLLISLAIRHRLADAPLERDEGEYAYLGWLLLEGVPPFADAANMKLPGTSMAYAAGMSAFGPTPRGIRLTLMLVNGLTTLAVFGLTRTLAGSWAGLFAAGTFALVSLQPTLLGLAGHATHFVALPAVLTAWLLIPTDRPPSAPRSLLAGLWAGIAFVMKQPGLYFALMGVALIAYSCCRSSKTPADLGTRAIRITSFLVGWIVPVGLLCAWIQRSGTWDEFWLWTFTYARSYGSQNNWTSSWLHLKHLLSSCGLLFTWLTLLSAVGLSAPWWRPELRRHWFFLWTFFVASLLTTTPGGWFRSHYFLTMAPAWGVLAGLAALSLARLQDPNGKVKLWVMALVSLPLLDVAVFRERVRLFQLTPTQFARQRYYPNFMDDYETIAERIQRESQPDDRLAVVGSEPQIAFLARRRLAAPFLYTYPLVEVHPLADAMNDRFIQSVEKSKPKFVVFVRSKYSWAFHPEGSKKTLNWVEPYLAKGYRLVGVLDHLGKETRLRWDGDIGDGQPASEDAVFIFRRNDAK